MVHLLTTFVSRHWHRVIKQSYAAHGRASVAHHNNTGWKDFFKAGFHLLISTICDESARTEHVRDVDKELWGTSIIWIYWEKFRSFLKCAAHYNGDMLDHSFARKDLLAQQQQMLFVRASNRFAEDVNWLLLQQSEWSPVFFAMRCKYSYLFCFRHAMATNYATVQSYVVYMGLTNTSVPLLYSIVITLFKTSLLVVVVSVCGTERAFRNLDVILNVFGFLPASLQISTGTAVSSFPLGVILK